MIHQSITCYLDPDIARGRSGVLRGIMGPASTTSQISRGARKHSGGFRPDIHRNNSGAGGREKFLI